MRMIRVRPTRTSTGKRFQTPESTPVQSGEEAWMLTEEQNKLLTEVEGEALMGRYMRERFWIPCARVDSLVADGAPKLVRLLGKNYVAFRATDGRVGMFDEACPHRGVSLTLARNEDCALRCIFH